MTGKQLMKRLNVELPQPLYKRLKKHVRFKGELAFFVRKAVEEFINGVESGKKEVHYVNDDDGGKS